MTSRLRLRSNTHFRLDRLIDIREAAWWLKTPFGASQMVADFGASGRIEVCFNVTLPNGDFLTSPNQKELLTDIYDFLCIQTHPLATGKRKSDNAMCRRRVFRALHIIDYFLINAESMQIDRFGLRSVVATELKQFLITIASRPDIANSIYNWNERLKNFVRTEGAKLSSKDFAVAIEKVPALESFDIPDKDLLLTGITVEEILKGRAALWLAGLYKKAPNKTPYELGINTAKISKLIYANTLLGVTTRKRIPEELCLAPFEKYLRERSGVAVRATPLDDICSESNFSYYKNCLMAFQPLGEVGVGIPSKSFVDLSEQRLQDLIALKGGGRFRTVPPDYIVHTLSAAIDFFYTHGKHLFKSYINVLKAAKGANVPIQKFATESSITPFLEKATISLGVKYWSLKWHIAHVELYDNKKVKSRRSSLDYFSRMREEKQGLMELIQAQFGAMQLIVGTLMAPRYGELVDLPLNCVDESETWLNLLTRKSGYGDLRREDSRPLPIVAADVVRHIQRLHQNLCNEGLGSGTYLFETPSIRGGFFRSHIYFNFCIDIFLDFINAPLTNDGCRYYIRQHQLRRAFAMLFFVSSGFAGLDTLRWFLRQIDPEHLYNYLTESIPGAVLRTMKSVAVALMVRDGDEQYINLTEFIKARFGASTFEVLDEIGFERYVNYIDQLQKEKVVEIEPVFFRMPEDVDYKIAVTVWGDNEY